jgi:hypothetical protein
MECKNYAKQGEEKVSSTRTITNRLISRYNMYACRAVVNTAINLSIYERQGISLTVWEKLLASNGVLFATASVSTYVIAT